MSSALNELRPFCRERSIRPDSVLGRCHRRIDLIEDQLASLANLCRRKHPAETDSTDCLASPQRFALPSQLPGMLKVMHQRRSTAVRTFRSDQTRFRLNPVDRTDEDVQKMPRGVVVRDRDLTILVASASPHISNASIPRGPTPPPDSQIQSNLPIDSRAARASSNSPAQARAFPPNPTATSEKNKSTPCCRRAAASNTHRPRF